MVFSSKDTTMAIDFKFGIFAQVVFLIWDILRINLFSAFKNNLPWKMVLFYYFYRVDAQFPYKFYGFLALIKHTALRKV